MLRRSKTLSWLYKILEKGSDYLVTDFRKQFGKSKERKQEEHR